MTYAIDDFSGRTMMLPLSHILTVDGFLPCTGFEIIVRGRVSWKLFDLLEKRNVRPWKKTAGSCHVSLPLQFAITTDVARFPIAVIDPSPNGSGSRIFDADLYQVVDGCFDTFPGHFQGNARRDSDTTAFRV